jgi:hypothetical protein
MSNFLVVSLLRLVCDVTDRHDIHALLHDPFYQLFLYSYRELIIKSSCEMRSVSMLSCSLRLLEPHRKQSQFLP